MSNKFKDIDLENYRYYFLNYIINKIFFDPNRIKIDEKPYKTILIYYIEYVIINGSKYLKINSVNPWYFIINKMNRYMEKN